MYLCNGNYITPPSVAASAVVGKFWVKGIKIEKVSAGLAIDTQTYLYPCKCQFSNVL